ncbi:hypothetical protein PS9374_05482 [Planomonospora sphaerica]|uniref:Uncharacterized protein n=1 Tax=Planomonospora sphaerica TaxID=161355 RepID=A0A171DLN0_9ACTN|nr:hypothetical protein PS9374_05482 [Planomonospora sphaerica]
MRPRAGPGRMRRPAMTEDRDEMPVPQLPRCSWSGIAPEFLACHDTE